MRVCGEIQYPSSRGNVHSDICLSTEEILDERQVFHDLLDEFLDKVEKLDECGDVDAHFVLNFVNEHR